MKFRLETTKRFYNIKEIPKLEKLGFTFSSRAIKGRPEIEFTNLEELMEFSREWGELIISFDEIGSHYLEIYDGYRE